MFFIFDKQKICSYLVAASTVAILFILSFFFINTDNIKTIETSSNTTNTNKLNIIEMNNNK